MGKREGRRRGGELRREGASFFSKQEFVKNYREVRWGGKPHCDGWGKIYEVVWSPFWKGNEFINVVERNIKRRMYCITCTWTVYPVHELISLRGGRSRARMFSLFDSGIFFFSDERENLGRIHNLARGKISEEGEGEGKRVEIRSEASFLRLRPAEIKSGMVQS